MGMNETPFGERTRAELNMHLRARTGAQRVTK